jgi:hypothetical protein
VKPVDVHDGAADDVGWVKEWTFVWAGRLPPFDLLLDGEEGVVEAVWQTLVETLTIVAVASPPS